MSKRAQARVKASFAPLSSYLSRARRHKDVVQLYRTVGDDVVFGPCDVQLREVRGRYEIVCFPHQQQMELVLGPAGLRRGTDGVVVIVAAESLSLLLP